MSQFQYNRRAIATIRLHARTMSAQAIAAIMHIPVGTVETICRRHDIAIITSGSPPTPQESPRERPERRPATIEIALDPDTYARLRQEAARRDIAPSGLIRQIVEVVAADRLYTAVLD